MERIVKMHLSHCTIAKFLNCIRYIGEMHVLLFISRKLHSTAFFELLSITYSINNMTLALYWPDAWKYIRLAKNFTIGSQLARSQPNVSDIILVHH